MPEVYQYRSQIEEHHSEKELRALERMNGGHAKVNQRCPPKKEYNESSRCCQEGKHIERIVILSHSYMNCQSSRLFDGTLQLHQFSVFTSATESSWFQRLGLVTRVLSHESRAQLHFLDPGQCFYCRLRLFRCAKKSLCHERRRLNGVLALVPKFLHRVVSSAL